MSANRGRSYNHKMSTTWWPKCTRKGSINMTVYSHNHTPTRGEWRMLRVGERVFTRESESTGYWGIVSPEKVYLQVTLSRMSRLYLCIQQCIHIFIYIHIYTAHIHHTHKQIMKRCLKFERYHRVASEWMRREAKEEELM